jgi:DNA polymerase III psi subunit
MDLTKRLVRFDLYIFPFTVLIIRLQHVIAEKNFPKGRFSRFKILQFTALSFINSNIHCSKHDLFILAVQINEKEFLGNNEKKVLIVVNNPEAAFLTENELAFLTKILEACGLNMADVAIINWNNLISKDYKSILETLKSKTVLLFAVDAETFGLPFRFPHFQIQHFDQCIYLQAPALSTIEEDVTAKKQLWTSLKSLFQL